MENLREHKSAVKIKLKARKTHYIQIKAHFYCAESTGNQFLALKLKPQNLIIN
jgi:predicted pyridoxine 5'-phosphate oxidase superfamily flavin-nucleotide-binding protein